MWLKTSDDSALVNLDHVREIVVVEGDDPTDSCVLAFAAKPNNEHNQWRLFEDSIEECKTFLERLAADLGAA